MIVNRIEKHLIKKSNSMWNIIDQKCWKSKNLYNSANYIIRQEFFKTNKRIKKSVLDKQLQQTKEYKELGSQASQRTLFCLDKSWKSFFEASGDYIRKNGKGYLGKPQIPKYKNKEKGRYILTIKNIQCKIKDGKLIFSWKPLKEFSGIKTNVVGKLMQVRFIPSGSCYFMEIVYQIEVPEATENKNRIMGIDLGVNNFATVGNNIGIKPIIIKGGVIKSMNQYYNKKLAHIASETKMLWCNRMQKLTDKRRNKIDTYMHKISKSVVEYCKTNNVDTLVVGQTSGWKNGVELGHVNNQNFVYIPFEKFINQLRYKCENVGINFVTINEDYTSSTSFLDNEESVLENNNIKRRIKRGLFKSNNGKLINADLNSAYQIIKKAFPNAFEQWDTGCDSHPVVINI